jgi:hypothetical protein
LEGKDHVEDLSEDGRIILKRISQKQGVDLIHLIRDTEKWRDVLNTVINLVVP